MDGGVYTEAEVDALIDLWHDGADPDQALHDFLGWTPGEYGHWVRTGHIPGTR
jgi:hypothetical protein